MRRLPWSIPVALVLACAPAAKAPVDLAAPVPGHEARAGVVKKAADLIGGDTAVGRVGDFELENARIRVIVQQPGPSSGYDTYGGQIVDADVVRAPGEAGHSRFGEAIPVYDFRTPRGVSATVVNDGRDGKAAVVRVHAVDDAFPLIEAVLGQNRPDMHLSIDTDYVLEPDSDFVRELTTVTNGGTAPVYLTDHYVGYVMGDGLHQFLPGVGFDLPTLPPPSPYYAAVADDVSYSFYSLDSDFTPIVTFQGFLLGGLGAFSLDPGASNTLETDVVVGAGDLAKHQAIQRRIRAKAGLDSPPVQTVSGRVAEASGAAVAGAKVNVVDAKRGYVSQTVSAKDGTFSLALEDGDYELSAMLVGRDPGLAMPITVAGAAISNVALPVGETGTLEFHVTSGGEAIPAKVSLVRADAPAELPGSFGAPGRHHGFERVEFLLPGTQKLEVPPGSWRVVVSRGFEYELSDQTATVTAGETTKVTADLAHVVDTTGWLSADYHVHAQWSPDSDDLLEKKARSFAAEGLEVPVSTEHEYIGDFNPTIQKLGLGDFVHALVGEEVSTTNLGHFNVFPLIRQPLVANFGAVEWYGVKGGDLMKTMRKLPGSPLLQVNHPRSDSYGAPIVKGYFSAVGLDDQTFTVRNDRDWTTDYDSIEIANGGTPLYEDWYAFLDRGMRMLATGDSDSHVAEDVVVGYPRNYVLAGTDRPAELDTATYMANLRAGLLTVSGGFFVEASVGTHRLGELLPASEVVDGKLPLSVRVQAPSWVPDGRLEVVVDGAVVATQPLTPPADAAGAVRFSGTLEVPVPTDADAYVFARVVSDGRLGPVYTDPAFGFTNPIFVDANGNGKFDARVP